VRFESLAGRSPMSNSYAVNPLEFLTPKGTCTDGVLVHAELKMSDLVIEEDMRLQDIEHVLLLNASQQEELAW